ncbi:MAG: AAA family ATPase [Caldilineaceae bacterium]
MTNKTPILIAICGLPGSGKSSVARMVAQKMEAVHLNSDRIRRELFAERTYAVEESRTVYQTLFQRARETLAVGAHVVLDATFIKAAHRQPIFELARDAGARLQLICVTCAPAVTEARLATRVGDVSEADIDVYRLLAAQFEPIAEPHIHIDNSANLPELAQQVEAKILACILINGR